MLYAVWDRVDLEKKCTKINKKHENETTFVCHNNTMEENDRQVIALQC